MVALPTQKRLPKAVIIQLCQDQNRRLSSDDFHFDPANARQFPTTKELGEGIAAVVDMVWPG